MTTRLTVIYWPARLGVTTILLAMFLSASGFATAATLLQDDFNSYTSIGELTSSGPWTYVTPTATLESTGCYSGKCVKIPYSGEDYKPIEKNVNSSNASEIYVRLRFKITGAGVGGIKFLKVFGKVLNESTQGEYANNTWNLGENYGPDPTKLQSVCYGEGEILQNDTNVCAYFDGTIHGPAGAILYKTKTNNFTPAIDTWYLVETYQKYNTNGNRDGEYWIKINGFLAMHITNVKNRNDANIREFHRVQFGDYSNRYANLNLYIDDITISTSTSSPADVEKTPTPPIKLVIN